MADSAITAANNIPSTRVDNTCRDYDGMHRLFAIPELLHLILAFLPLNELLIHQRVCHSWQEGVLSDPTLQRILYRRAGPEGLVSWTAKSSPQDRPFDFLHETGEWQYGDGRGTIPYLNPFLHRYITYWRPGGFLSILHPGFIGEPTHFPYRFDRTLDEHYDRTLEEIEEVETLGPRSAKDWEAMCYSKASWRNLFMMQPPCRKLEFYCNKNQNFIVLLDPRGLKLGEVVEFLRAHSRACPNCTDGHVVPRWDFRGNRIKQIATFFAIPDGEAMQDLLEMPCRNRSRSRP